MSPARGGARVAAGMVGGGLGSNIGETHRQGMRLDDRYDLVAGSFSRDVSASRELAARLGVADDRVYGDYRRMAEVEAGREDGIELAVVATPNDSHAEVAAAFLSRGIAVVCEKPLTTTSADAAELVALSRRTGAVLAVAHCYSAYAMVRQAARMIRDGELGEIRMVVAEHASGWAATPLENEGHKQAGWRTDPRIGGRASAVADLGTHALHLVRFMTGLEVGRLSADLTTLVPGRRVYDNATIRLTLSNGAPATLWATMSATGNAHGLRVRVFGERSALEWQHEDPHHLTVRALDGRTTVLTQGMAGLSAEAARVTRAGLGHPEGFLEAFATFYSDVADAVVARREGRSPRRPELTYPDGLDGLVGVRFVEATVASHEAGGAWVDTHFTTDTGD